MNKGEFIKAIAKKTGETDKKVDAFYKAFVETVTESLENGEKVVLVGFGSFEIKEKTAREGINPRTGAKVNIPATKVPAFKMGKSYKDSFNK